MCVDDIPANANSEDDFHLPPHQRCACHSLNVIATHDIETANADGAYKSLVAQHLPSVKHSGINSHVAILQQK